MMAIILIQPDFSQTPPLLLWKCPCGHVNYHKGKPEHKMSPEEREEMQACVDNAAEHLYEQIEAVGGDIGDAELHVLADPGEVWCVKCEERHTTHPVVDNPDWTPEEFSDGL